MSKIYKIKTTKIRMVGGPRVDEASGTLEELIRYYSYTLEVGSSWNPKINRNPKTIKSFVSNLKKSFEEKEARCYDRTYVELIE